MSNNIVLLVVEALALVACIGGIAAISPGSTYLSLGYLGAWFLLGIGCNVAGLVSLYYFYSEDKGQIAKAHDWLHKHFLLCWLTMILGYPTLVTCFWLNYYPTAFAHLFCILGILPFVAWLLEKGNWVQLLTPIGMGILIFLHVLICLGAENWAGLAGAVLMVANVISLSTPTSQTTYLGISAREGFVGGVAIASLLFALAVRDMYDGPKLLIRSIIPKIVESGGDFIVDLLNRWTK